MYLMLNRFTVSIAFLAGLVSMAMAQDMHVFSNGTVADADKINDNFAAIDQEGPTITYSEPVMESATSGEVTVTVSDPSGVFGWGAASISYGPYETDREVIVFEPHAPAVSVQWIYTPYNETGSLVMYASDLRGNRSVKKVDYQGPTSVAKAGAYESEGELVLADLCNAGVGQQSIKELGTLLSETTSPYPAMKMLINLCPSIDENSMPYCVTSGLTTDFVEGQATDTVWTFDTDSADSHYSRTVGLTFSGDGLSVVATYDEVADCSFTGGQVETQSGSLTLTYKTEP